MQAKEEKSRFETSVETHTITHQQNVEERRQLEKSKYNITCGNPIEREKTDLLSFIN